MANAARTVKVKQVKKWMRVPSLRGEKKVGEGRGRKGG